MKTTSAYQRQVGLLTILSAFFALASMVAGAVGVEYNFDAFTDPTVLLQYSSHYQYAKWSVLFDMFGYYLLLLPVAFYLHEQVKQRTPWANVLTFCGLAYIFIGAIGAGILASVWPQQMQRYLTADAEQKIALQAALENVTWIVYGGMWNILEVLLCGVWWVGVGLVIKENHKAPGWATVVLGVSTLLDGMGNMFGLETLAEAGLNVYLALAIVWAAWIGDLIRRGKM